MPDELGSLKGPWSTDNQHERCRTDSNDHKTFEKVIIVSFVDNLSLLRSYVVSFHGSGSLNLRNGR